MLEKRRGRPALRAPRDLPAADRELPSRHRGQTGTRAGGPPALVLSPRNGRGDAEGTERERERLGDPAVALRGAAAEPPVARARGDAVGELARVEKRAAARDPAHHVDAVGADRVEIERARDVLVGADRYRGRIEGVEPERRRGPALGPLKERLVEGHVLGSRRRGAHEQEPSIHLNRDPRGSRNPDTGRRSPRRAGGPAS